MEGFARALGVSDESLRVLVGSASVDQLLQQWLRRHEGLSVYFSMQSELTFGGGRVQQRTVIHVCYWQRVRPGEVSPADLSEKYTFIEESRDLAILRLLVHGAPVRVVPSVR